MLRADRFTVSERERVCARANPSRPQFTPSDAPLGDTIPPTGPESKKAIARIAGMQLSILFKGRTEQLEVGDGADLSELHDAAALLFGLVDMTIKLIQRGKTLPTMGAIAAHAKPGAKLMMVASARAAMASEPKADPTVRGFDHDLADAAARCHEVAAEEVGVARARQAVSLRTSLVGLP